MNVKVRHLLSTLSNADGEPGLGLGLLRRWTLDAGPGGKSELPHLHLVLGRAQTVRARNAHGHDLDVSNPHLTALFVGRKREWDRCFLASTYDAGGAIRGVRAWHCLCRMEYHLGFSAQYSHRRRATYRHPFQLQA